MNPLILITLMLGCGNFVQPPLEPPLEEPALEATLLENLPTGQYLYRDGGADGAPRRGSILLRKIGHTVIGLDQRPRAGNACFRGFLEGDRILNATRIYPPYQPDSRWEQQPGTMVDLSQYRSVDAAVTHEQAAMLHTCLTVFSR